MIKLAIIGSGSMVFTRRIVTDLLLDKNLSGMEIALMDIDPEKLRVSELIVNAVANEIGVKPTISTHIDRKTALKNADFVQTTFQVGGFDPSTKIDFNIPKKYGLKQTIADTLGIGGIMRGLRTIPILLDVAKDIMEICPKAIWLQSVNPMAMNIMAISKKFPEINVIGLCHSVPLTAMMLANDLEEKFEDIVFECAGINHMSFYLSFQKQLPDGSTIDLYPKLKQIAKNILNGQKVSSRTQKKTSHGKFLSEKVRYDILMRLGYFVTESSEHFSEYVPWYIKNNHPNLIDKFKIPIDDYILRCENQNKIWKNHSKNLTHNSNLEISSSNEYASEIIKSLATSNKIQVNGNVINNGAIKNLPNDCCVEIPCDIDKKGIHPQEIGNLPIQLAALISTNVNVQQLTVEAALNHRREHVYHAAMVDPHTASELSLDQIYQMVDELIEAHGEMIPKLI